MSGTSVLQTAYEALLARTTEFFETLETNGPQDTVILQALYEDALRLIALRSHPDFPLLLTYLLGTRLEESDYPRQVLRFIALTETSCHYGGITQDIASEELCLAAFFADLGFRAAWLGHQWPHAQVISTHLGTLRFPWYGPRLHRLILKHHLPEEDLSPAKILSFWSRFLEIAFGMGNENIQFELTTLVNALQKAIREYHTYSETQHVALRTLGTYPLSSWVRLNSGNIGLVVQPNSENPLRPILLTHGETGLERLDLAAKPILHIVRDESPSPSQKDFMEHPELWINQWTGPRRLTPHLLDEVFTTDRPILANTAKSFPLEMISPEEIKPAPPPRIDATPTAPAWQEAPKVLAARMEPPQAVDTLAESLSDLRKLLSQEQLASRKMIEGLQRRLDQATAKSAKGDTAAKEALQERSKRANLDSLEKYVAQLRGSVDEKERSVSEGKKALDELFRNVRDLTESFSPAIRRQLDRYIRKNFQPAIAAVVSNGEAVKVRLEMAGSLLGRVREEQDSATFLSQFRSLESHVFELGMAVANQLQGMTRDTETYAHCHDAMQRFIATLKDLLAMQETSRGLAALAKGDSRNASQAFSGAAGLAAEKWEFHALSALSDCMTAPAQARKNFGLSLGLYDRDDTFKRSLLRMYAQTLESSGGDHP